MENVMEQHLREELRIANTHLVSCRSECRKLHFLLKEALAKIEAFSNKEGMVQ